MRQQKAPRSSSRYKVQASEREKEFGTARVIQISLGVALNSVPLITYTEGLNQLAVGGAQGFAKLLNPFLSCVSRLLLLPYFPPPRRPGQDHPGPFPPPQAAFNMVNMSNGQTFQERLNVYEFVPPIADFFELAKHVARTAPNLAHSSTPPPNMSQYDAIIRAKTKEAIRNYTAAEAFNQQQSQSTTKPTPTLSDGEALLIYIGNYFNNAAQICDQIFIGVLKCTEVIEAGMRWKEQASRENDLDNHIRTAEAEQIIHKLFKMRDLTANYAREMQEVWDPSIRSDESSNKLPPLTSSYEDMMRLSRLIPPGSPSPEPMVSFMKPPKLQGLSPQQQSQSPQQHQPRPPSQQQHRRSVQTQTQSRHSLEHREKLKQEHSSPPGEDSASEMSEDEEEEEAEEDAFAKIDMEALKSRGKGNHTCPKGKRCTKGGIDKDGELIVFDRNSAFVQHCNKHRKPYRCNLQGCPNQPKKRRFARRDGLERHQRSVPHLTTSLQTAS